MKIKPEQLLLPPNFIHERSFHESLLEYRCNLLNVHPEYSDEYLLWHTVIAEAIRHRESREYARSCDERKINHIRRFCKYIKGLYVITELYPNLAEDTGLLFLEDLTMLPSLMIEDSYINQLRNKYNVGRNLLVEFKDRLYSLLDTNNEYIGNNNFYGTSIC